MGVRGAGERSTGAMRACVGMKTRSLQQESAAWLCSRCARMSGRAPVWSVHLHRRWEEGKDRCEDRFGNKCEDRCGNKCEDKREERGEDRREDRCGKRCEDRRENRCEDVFENGCSRCARVSVRSPVWSVHLHLGSQAESQVWRLVFSRA